MTVLLFAVGLVGVTVSVAGFCLFKLHMVEEDVTALDRDFVELQHRIEAEQRKAVQACSRRLDGLAGDVAEAQRVADWAAAWVAAWLPPQARK